MPLDLRAIEFQVEVAGNIIKKKKKNPDAGLINVCVLRKKKLPSPFCKRRKSKGL